MTRQKPIAVAVVALSLAAAAAGPAPLAPARPAHPRTGLGAQQRQRAEALISEFENSTTALPYCHVEAIGDGRGYTVGRVGFTSANGDLLEVTVRYTRAVPGNPLAPLIGRLRQLARDSSGSTAGLDELPAAWAASCRDARQRRAQDAVVDELYYRPAQHLWRSLGLRTPLSLAAIYDAMIQHGGGSDPDGVPAIVRRASRIAHGTPRNGVSETRYMTAFLTARRAILAHAHDPASRRGFAASVSRVEVWRYLLRSRQMALAAPLRVRTPEYRLTLH